VEVTVRREPRPSREAALGGESRMGGEARTAGEARTSDEPLMPLHGGTAREVRPA
jgi:hypothetical protein